jgi:hypothetical protein
VRLKSHGVKQFDHPIVGEMSLQYEVMALSDVNQSLVIYAPADPAAQEPLNLLAAWAPTGSRSS